MESNCLAVPDSVMRGKDGSLDIMEKTNKQNPKRVVLSWNKGPEFSHS